MRIVIKIDDLPLGTTEIVYRITLLDENQQLASSLLWHLTDGPIGLSTLKTVGPLLGKFLAELLLHNLQWLL